MDRLTPDSGAVDWTQVRLILGLRWRLLLRDAKTRPVTFTIRTALMVAFVGFAVLLSVGVYAAAFRLLRNGEVDAARGLVHGVHLLGFVWLAVGPVLAFGANEFLDVTRLFHLPVGHRTVFVASLLGIAASPGVLLAALPMLASALAWHGGVVSTLWAVTASLLVIAAAVALGHLGVLALLNTLRSRRWRDVMMVVGPAIGVGFYLLSRVLVEGGVGEIVPALRAIDLHRDWMMPLPSWWGATAVVAPGWAERIPVLFLIPLLVVVVRIGAGLQERAFHGEVPGGPAPQSAKRSGRGILERIPGPLGALAAKDLALLKREPVVRMVAMQGAAFTLTPLLLLLLRAMGTESAVVEDAARVAKVLPFVSLVGLAALVSEFALLLNLLGLEGGGMVHALLTPVPRRTFLLGKDLAHLFAFGGANGILAAVAVLAAYGWAGRPGEGVLRGGLAAVESLCYVCVALSIGNLVSVFVPLPLVARDRRALRQQMAGARGCFVAFKQSLGFAVVGAACTPVLILFHHADFLHAAGAGLDTRPWLLLTVPLAVIFCAGALAASAAWGGARLAATEERVAAALSRQE